MGKPTARGTRNPGNINTSLSCTTGSDALIHVIHRSDAHVAVTAVHEAFKLKDSIGRGDVPAVISWAAQGQRNVEG